MRVGVVSTSAQDWIQGPAVIFVFPFCVFATPRPSVTGLNYPKQGVIRKLGFQRRHRRAAPSPDAGSLPPPPRRAAAESRSIGGSNSRGVSGSGPETSVQVAYEGVDRWPSPGFRRRRWNGRGPYRRLPGRSRMAAKPTAAPSHPVALPSTNLYRDSKSCASGRAPAAGRRML